MDNLPEIRDIHIPDGVSYFPIAYGWWIILIGIIAVILLIKFIAFAVRTSKRLYALKQLKNINTDNPVIAAVKLSELLRRICHFKFREASALYGEDWIKFLNEHTSHKIAVDCAKLLVYAPFMSVDDKSYSPQTAEELKNFCKYWIGANL